MKMVAQVETRTQQGFIEKLKEKGLKPTSERLLIFKEATKLPHHFSADELAFKVWQKDERVSRATVYRTIPLLLEFGVLREVVFSDKHQHLICLKCGKIIEFSDDRMETPLDEACEKFNFKAVAHKTEVTGYCKNCH
jgi:Fur family ferric uptake transcriptional regulator